VGLASGHARGRIEERGDLGHLDENCVKEEGKGRGSRARDEKGSTSPPHRGMRRKKNDGRGHARLAAQFRKEEKKGEKK